MLTARPYAAARAGAILTMEVNAMTIITKEARHARETKGMHRGAHHPNVGGWERGVRMFIGLAAMGASAAVPIWLRPVMLLLGVGGLATSVSAYCPVNHALGRDSHHSSLF